MMALDPCNRAQREDPLAGFGSESHKKMTAKGAMMSYWRQKLAEIWSMFVGISITGRFIFSPRVTVRYPKKTVPDEDVHTFNGPIELVPSPIDPTLPKCISCMMCVQACPSGCIAVKKSPPPKLTPEQEEAFKEAEARGEKPKRPAAPKNPLLWHYDFTRCSLCGTCIDTCPVQSIRFSNDVYVAARSREELHYDLLAKVRRKAQEAAEGNAAEPPCHRMLKGTNAERVLVKSRGNHISNEREATAENALQEEVHE